MSLVVGVGLILAGMAWLSCVCTDSSYLTAVAWPMVLIGIGQGLAFPPMTSAGLGGVDAPDAGAASGLVNTFHQLGSALGLGVLATISAAAVPGGESDAPALVDRVSAALTGGTVMLAVAVLVALVVIARRESSDPRPALSPALRSITPAREPAGRPLPDHLHSRVERQRIGHDMDKNPSTTTVKTPAANFTGDVWMNPVFSGDGTSHLTCGLVRFTPGARTNWHSHANGQLLVCTDGIGLVGTRDGKAVVLRAGESVWTPAGEEHFHGGTAQNMMCHYAILDASVDDGEATTWLEPVTDGQYSAAQSAAGV